MGREDYYKTLKLLKCPICGKKFIPAPYHAYRIGGCESTRVVCSYTCMRVWEKKNLRSEENNEMQSKQTKK